MKKSTDTVERLAYKIPEAAAALSVGRSTVYALLHSGRLRYVRLAQGSIRIPRAALDAFLEGKR